MIFFQIFLFWIWIVYGQNCTEINDCQLCVENVNCQYCPESDHNTSIPTASPTVFPSPSPTAPPTSAPTTNAPTSNPTPKFIAVTEPPTLATLQPTAIPTLIPTPSPTPRPTPSDEERACALGAGNCAVCVSLNNAITGVACQYCLATDSCVPPHIYCPPVLDNELGRCRKKSCCPVSVATPVTTPESIPAPIGSLTAEWPGPLLLKRQITKDGGQCQAVGTQCRSGKQPVTTGNEKQCPLFVEGAAADEAQGIAPSAAVSPSPSTPGASPSTITLPAGLVGALMGGAGALVLLLVVVCVSFTMRRNRTRQLQQNQAPMVRLRASSTAGPGSRSRSNSRRTGSRRPSTGATRGRNMFANSRSRSGSQNQRSRSDSQNQRSQRSRSNSSYANSNQQQAAVGKLMLGSYAALPKNEYQVIQMAQNTNSETGGSSGGGRSDTIGSGASMVYERLAPTSVDNENLGTNEYAFFEAPASEISEQYVGINQIVKLDTNDN